MPAVPGTVMHAYGIYYSFCVYTCMMHEGWEETEGGTHREDCPTLVNNTDGGLMVGLPPESSAKIAGYSQEPA